jgi:hypothetical protein
MRYIVLFFATVMMGLVIGCSKSSSSSKGGGGGSKGGTFAFSGYQYEGFMTQLSREWQKPILVQFNSDSTVTDYCFFYLNVNNNWLSIDSLTGQILSVGTGSGGGPSVTVYFKATADTQVYNFSPDLSGVNGGSNGLASNQFYFSALTKITKTAASLSGSYWTSDTSKEQNGTYGSPWYPDINGVQFSSNGTTNYVRNGGPVEIGVVPNDTLVYIKYWQYGNRVYFYGYNENYDEGIPYWGVISDDGNTINADTEDFTIARVPNYDQTNDYYGDSGNPPVMHRRLN